MSTVNYNIELQVFNPGDDASTVCSIAQEHGFKKIAVPQGRVAEFARLIDPATAKIVAVIDYPFGESSTDCRSYQIRSSKENGAMEVEVVAPYYLTATNNKIFYVNDIETLHSVSSDCKIDLRLVLDTKSKFLTKEVLSNYAKFFNRKRKYVSICASLGYFDSKTDVSDIVLWIRDLKKEFICPVTCYANIDDVEDMSTLVKSGIDMISLDWKRAPELMYAYANLIGEETSDI